MGRITTLYGYIQEFPDRAQAYTAHNEQVLTALPRESEWPFFNATLFQTPPPLDTSEISYWGRVISFGGSYKTLEDAWAEWLEKFEALLQQLVWYEARVHLITEWYGEATCEWQIENNYSARLRKAKEPFGPDPQDWTFTGPRLFK